MTAVALMLWPVERGWEVVTTDGHKLARFTGLAARWRAERFLSRYLQPRVGWR